ncbi:unnamed protein product [Allacma fusca]|uniref:lysozyme n=2 Tax=Allacma fusca TaxID=39272 RepID=A0A8J2LJN5_9HEXA|nr:unnamed protein product [Allacma fusca]
MKIIFTAIVLVVLALAGIPNVLAQPGRFTSRCKLAYDLRDHGVANLAAWVCLADVHTNGRFDNLHKQGDGYGLWEISAKNWCRDGLFRSKESSRCNLDCDRTFEK